MNIKRIRYRIAVKGMAKPIVFPPVKAGFPSAQPYYDAGNLPLSLGTEPTSFCPTCSYTDSTSEALTPVAKPHEYQYPLLVKPLVAR